VPLRARSVRGADSDSEEMKIAIATNNRFYEYKEGDEMNFNCTDLSASNYTLTLTKGFTIHLSIIFCVYDKISNLLHIGVFHRGYLIVIVIALSAFVLS